MLVHWLGRRTGSEMGATLRTEEAGIYQYKIWFYSGSIATAWVRLTAEETEAGLVAADGCCSYGVSICW